MKSLLGPAEAELLSDECFEKLDQHALTEAAAHLQRDHRTDTRAYNRIHRQILAMADMLSDGIAAQFPNRFR